VSFDIARPLLDRKLYVVLSDFSNTLNGEPLAPISLDNSMEVQTDYAGQEDLNDMPIDDDDEMSELDFEDSDDESGSEPSVLTSVQMEDGSVGDILIGLKGSRVRYKVNILEYG